MVSQLLSTTLVGVEAHFVRVEVDLATGLPGVHVVGLPDTAVGESIHRVRSALRSVEKPLPPRRVTVNLAPGDLRKEGPRSLLCRCLCSLNVARAFAAISRCSLRILRLLNLQNTRSDVSRGIQIHLCSRPMRSRRPS